MKWGQFAFLLILLVFPVSAQLENFDTLTLSSNIKAGQRFVWMDYNQYYPNATTIPDNAQGTNYTVIVTKTPGDTDVRGMIPENFFDFYVDGQKRDLITSPLVNDDMGRVFIQSKNYNGTEDYFDWFIAAYGGKNTKIDGDYFYYSTYLEYGNEFTGSKYYTQINATYHVESGISFFYSFVMYNVTGSEINYTTTRVLVSPSLGGPATSSLSNSKPDTTSNDNKLLFPFVLLFTLVLITLYPTSRRKLS